MPSCIGVVAAGAMGGPLAAVLVKNGASVYTTLDGRSAASRKRSEEAGLLECSTLFALLGQCDIIISIVPPHTAVDFARQTVASSSNTADKIFADLNAVSPQTAVEIKKIVTEGGFRYVDGSIIGGPPSENYNPTVYLSSANEDALQEVAQLGKQGWVIKVLHEEKDGAAKAIKNSYAGIAKGLSGLASAAILSAYAFSQITGDALVAELASSQPAILKSMTGGLVNLRQKSWRFVGEMQEIADYIDSQLGNDNGSIYRGLAKRFQDAANDADSSSSPQADRLDQVAKLARESLP